jgi:zinc/manganese transport system substrate-binding protein
MVLSGRVLSGPVLSGRGRLRSVLRVSGLAVAAVASVSALAACSDEGSARTSGAAPLVATTTIWADITSHVACGEHVTSIIPSGADPHSFEPSLRDRELLTESGALIANGGGLEESLTDLVRSAGRDGVHVVEVADHVDLVGGNPHVWQDPRRVIEAVDAIESAVVAAGRDAATIKACADGYREDLTRLDADIATALERVPPERRVLVTNHDAFGYFAGRYGFEVVGTVIPSSSTLGEGSAGQLADLADAIERYRVPAIFAERLGSAKEAEALAKRIGVEVVELDSDALESDGPAATYTGMMRGNAAAIAAALS